MPQMKLRMHVVGINRGVISDTGQNWAKVQTTEPFDVQDGDTIGERAVDVSASYGFLDQVKSAGIKLPADLDVICNLTITKSKSRVVVQSLDTIGKTKAA